MKKHYLSKFSKQLAQYGALTAVMAGAADANGQIVYTDEVPDFAGGIGSQYFLDLNNDGTDDFRIWHNGSSNLYISPLTSNNGALGSGSATFAYPFVLSSGATISSGAGTFFNNGFAGGYQSLNYGSCSFGNWCNITDGYIGLEFDFGGDTYYGWARLDVDFAGDNWAVKDYAFESSPNTPILAGATTSPGGDPPVIVCPLDIVADNAPGECAAVANFAAAAIDTEDGDLSASITYSQDPGTSFPVGTTVVTASVTDSDGNTVTCDFNVTINDVEDPTVACMDITVELDSTGNYTLSPGEVVMSSDDNCGIVSTEFFFGSPIMESGNAPLPIPATGSSGPMDPSIATVTESGVLGADYSLENVMVNIQHTFSSDIEMDLVSPSGTSISLMYDDGGSSGTSTAQDFLFITGGADPDDWDFAGDTPDPALGFDPALEGQGGGLGFADLDGENINGDWTLVINDDAGGDSGTLNSFSISFAPLGSGTPTAIDFDCDDVGANSVTVQVTDAAGNTATCMATVTVEDNIAPIIACVGEPAPLTGTVSDDPAVAIPPSGDPAVTTTIDVTDDFEITDLDVDLDIDHTWIGDIVVTLESPSGTVVTLLDQVGVPATGFGCNNLDPNIVITLDDEAADAAEDSCPEPYVGTFSPIGSLSDFDGENTLGTWTLSIIDLVGGDDTNNFINEWGITYGYEVSATPLEIDLDANGMASIPASDLLLGVDEACGFTVTVATPPGVAGLTTLFNSNNGGAPGGAVYFDVTVGTADITLSGFETNTSEPDAFTMEVYAITGGTFVGNEADPAPWTLVGTASGTSNGIDVPSPATLDAPITLMANTTYAMALVMDATHSHSYSGTGTNPAPGALNYSNADLSIDLGSGSNAPFAGPTFNPRIWNGTLVYESTVPGSSPTLDLDCSNIGENQIEVTVTDDSGNVSTCIATVNVNDVTDPILVCQDITLPLDENGMAEIDPEDLLAVSPDIFNILVIGSDNASGTAGTTDFTVAVTEAATVSFDWIYSTTDAPGFDSFGYLLNGVYTELADADGQSGSESVSVAPGDVFGFRSETDDNTFGNNEVLISNFMPGFEGQFAQGNWNLELDNSDGSADFILAIPGGPLSFDACGITVLAVDIDEFDCDDIGTPVTVTVFASDASGNLASCTAVVTVVDELGPEITCPADQTVDPGPNNLQYEVPDYWATGEATAVDNCTDPLTIFTQDPAPGTLLEDGTYTVTLTAEDEFGNVSTCTFELIVESLLGQQDNPLANGITIYPNPADAQVILANNSGIQLERAQIFDVNGRLVMNLNLNNMGTERTIDVSQLATGAYLVQLEGEGQTATKRLIKR